MTGQRMVNVIFDHQFFLKSPGKLKQPGIPKLPNIN
jgi:hypothetical protein